MLAEAAPVVGRLLDAHMVLCSPLPSSSLLCFSCLWFLSLSLSLPSLVLSCCLLFLLVVFLLPLLWSSLSPSSSLLVVPWFSFPFSLLFFSFPSFPLSFSLLFSFPLLAL